VQRQVAERYAVSVDQVRAGADRSEPVQRPLVPFEVSVDQVRAGADRLLDRMLADSRSGWCPSIRSAPARTARAEKVKVQAAKVSVDQVRAGADRVALDMGLAIAHSVRRSGPRRRGPHDTLLCGGADAEVSVDQVRAGADRVKKSGTISLGPGCPSIRSAPARTAKVSKS